MEKLVETLIVNAPSLAGAITILFMLLRYMERREAAMLEITKGFRDSIAQQAEQCHEAQHQNAIVITSCVRAMSELSEKIEHLLNNHEKK